MLIGLIPLLLLAGCSVQKFVVNKAGDALSGPSLVVARDDDPDLVGDAAAFNLKLTESLLEKSPQHLGLLKSALTGFTQYSYAYVQSPAEIAEDNDFESAQRLHQRAKRMFLRARNYGLRALDVAHAGVSARLREDPVAALSVMQAPDVEVLYWTAVAWASAVGQGKDDPALIGDLPIVDALAARAEQLNPDYGEGALQNFLGTYEMARESRPPVARAHFARALALAHGQLAGPHVSLAESLCVPQRARAEFLSELGQALAIDADAYPDHRLENLIMQRRARWLQARVDDLFLSASE